MSNDKRSVNEVLDPQEEISLGLDLVLRSFLILNLIGTSDDVIQRVCSVTRARIRKTHKDSPDGPAALRALRAVSVAESFLRESRKKIGFS